ncbi:MAG TPA: pilus assembly protein PilM, partial [Phycisphaerae bacterium]|nr:pilus assembly protein PilM [Phycisphaerae bacterium]
MAEKKQKNVLPIGIDIGTDMIKIAQLVRNGDGFMLQACAEAVVPAHVRNDPLARLEFFSSAIPKVIREGSFSGKKCVLSVPAVNTLVRHVKVPRLDPAATRTAILRTAQDELSYPVADAVVQYLPITEIYTEGEPRQEILLIAVPRTTVEAYMTMAGHAHMDVLGLSIEALAIADCFVTLFDWAKDESQSNLFLDIGHATAQVVVTHGPKVAFVRNLEKGMTLLDESISDAMKISVEEARSARTRATGLDASGDEYMKIKPVLEPWLEGLADAIDKSLLYYQALYRKSGVNRIVFTGGFAQERRLCQLLAQRLNLPAQ